MNTANLRIGLVLKTAPFPEASSPMSKLWIDFGAELGVLPCVAPFADAARLEGHLVAAETGMHAQKTSGFISKAHLLTTTDRAGRAMALTPEHDAEPGTTIG